MALSHLQEKEQKLAAVCAAHEERRSGLVDLDAGLKLAQTRLAMCLVALDAMPLIRSGGIRRSLYTAAARRARSAVGILERLSRLNVSEDQRALVSEHPEYAESLRLLRELVSEGGAALLERPETDPRREKLIRDAVVRAVRKYADPDDRYVPLMGEGAPLPRLLHRLLRFLFPTILAEWGDGARCGMEEEDERLGVSERMRMPLSQAIHYTEAELLPTLKAALRDNPGEPLVQERIRALERQLRELRRLSFTPRSTPVIPEKDFYTEWITGYTPEGELLVNVVLPVTYRTGTNLSRTQELALSDVVRRLAGRGVCPDLDRQYRRLKSLSSGLRGSFRLPSFRLDDFRGFAALKAEFPYLEALESREEFRKLVELATRGGPRALEHGVQSLSARTDLPPRPWLPPLGGS